LGNIPIDYPLILIPDYYAPVEVGQELKRVLIIEHINTAYYGTHKLKSKTLPNKKQTNAY
jgi:hypothetical protein